MELLPPPWNPFLTHHEESLTPADTTLSGPERSPDAQQTSTLQQHELWNKTITLTRGRAPGDPHARIVNFLCQNIEDLRTCLQEHLASPNPEYPPEHTTVELIFPVSAAFLVADPFASTQPGSKPTEAPQAFPSPYGTLNSSVISVMEAMTPMPDPKDNMKKQRVIAKACIEAVQRADGNRYSFNNNWWSKEDEGNRFSYYCNDSILNKGRSANGGASTIGQKVQKPVYDCKGIVAVKFSAVKQNLQVQYKHLPVHKSYEERAPPPRRGTKRWKLAALYNPGSLVKLRKPKSVQNGNSNQVKRKRQTSSQTTSHALDEHLNLENQHSLEVAVPGADRPTTTPSSTRDPVGTHTRKPTHTVRKTKRANGSTLLAVPKAVISPPQSDGRVLYGHYTERAPLCTYAEGNRGNATAPEPEMETGMPVPQSELASRQTNIAASLKPDGRLSAILADVSEAPGRDVQKELGDAMSEFDMLKAKLAEAEQRVRRLEAEEKAAELERRVSLSTSHAPQMQITWPSLISLQPAGQSAPEPVEPPAWQVTLPRDYGSCKGMQ